MKKRNKYNTTVTWFSPATSRSEIASSVLQEIKNAVATAMVQ